MAWFEFDAKSGYYRICFRFNNQRVKRSKTLKITEEAKAHAQCEIVEETIKLVETGRIRVPEGVDPIDFILSGGRLTEPPKIAVPSNAEVRKLGELFDVYIEEMKGIEGRESSRKTEGYHIAHLSDPKLLGASLPISEITHHDI